MKALLQTKLFVPLTRSDLVNRNRLTTQLDEGLAKKITLISAPAGFGKTTLVTSWLKQSNLKSAWVSLDEGDSDPARFISYLFAALIKSNAISDSAQDTLDSPHHPNLESQLGALINDILANGAEEKIVVVLDDYHLIENQSVHQAINFLVENQPPQLHIVLISREDPPLHLSLLRGRGELLEIRLADLRFNNQESARLLNDFMALNLNPDQIEILGAKTEGWVSGLQLAALSMPSR